ncbi:growth hormone secretagogue receptor type 1-like protein, partial [Dinothrombium tinctorium]
LEMDFATNETAMPIDIIDSDQLSFPFSVRIVASFICIILLIIGFIGNALIPFVVLRNKDLRNSTNMFLINLSIADLLLLSLCTPTALIELNSQPEVWFLGEFM